MRCKHCKQKFLPKAFLQKYCMEQPECITVFLAEMKSKNSQKEKKDWNVKKKVMQEKLKTLGEYEKEARVEFQKYIRMRDEKYGCISCPTAITDLFDGGHYLKAELFSGLIFDEDNCHKQCRKCNHYQNGNELNYRDGLIARYGEQFVKDLELKKITGRFYKYTKEELISIKEIYILKQKEYGKSNNV